ncbi:hypothetical protein FJ251_03980 [bacterium]|nr:hypothetical protein [bacterium]
MRLATQRGRAGLGRHRREQTKAVLRLTSMMDIFTSLLLFLLKSFVVDGETVTPVPGVELPESRSEAPAPAALVVAVYDDAILVGDEQVASVGASLAGESLWIAGLGARLRAEHARSEAIAARRQGESPAPKVAIQGDRDIEFAILQRVMFTCNQSGYGQIALAVISTRDS